MTAAGGRGQSSPGGPARTVLRPAPLQSLGAGPADGRGQALLARTG